METLALKCKRYSTRVVNANSIRRKTTEIERLIMYTHLEQILITETKLGDQGKK